MNRRWAATAPLAAAVALAVVLPRLIVLYVSVIDWDESFYALVAQQWLAGHVPYETVFDHKPIGLYAIFASFFLLFGDSVIAIRLIALVFVAATAVLLGRAAEAQFGRSPWLAAWVAALYGIASLANGGLATNTEILVNFFVVLALWLVVASDPQSPLSVRRCVAIGGSLGLAFQVNYLAGILAAGAAGFYLCWIWNSQPLDVLARRYIRDGAFMVLGFLAAWLVALLPVFFWGDVREYFTLQLAYLTGYESPATAATVMRRVTEAATPWWPLVTAAVALAAWGRDRRVRAWLVFAAFALVAASASGYFYHHFFLFALPALIMLASAFIALVLESRATRVFCAAWLLLMAGLSIVNAQAFLVHGVRAHRAVMTGQPPDSVARAGEYLRRNLQAGETIFVYEDQPILYFLTRTTPPSRFAFPDYFTYEPLARRFGTTSRELLDDALDTSPRYVVAGPVRGRFADSDATHEFRARLEREYVAVSARDRGAPPAIFERAPGR